jgi:hypothetical protein
MKAMIGFSMALASQVVQASDDKTNTTRPVAKRLDHQHRPEPAGDTGGVHPPR